MTASQVQSSDRNWRLQNSLWIAGVLPLGLLTWASFLYVGISAKRRSWLVAAAGYGLALAMSFVVLSLAPELPNGKSDPNSWQTNVGFVLAIVNWIGGFIHALVVNRTWLKMKAAENRQTNAGPAYAVARWMGGRIDALAVNPTWLKMKAADRRQSKVGYVVLVARWIGRFIQILAVILKWLMVKASDAKAKWDAGRSPTSAGDRRVSAETNSYDVTSDGNYFSAASSSTSLALPAQPARKEVGGDDRLGRQAQAVEAQVTRGPLTPEWPLLLDVNTGSHAPPAELPVPLALSRDDVESEARSLETTAAAQSSGDGAPENAGLSPEPVYEIKPLSTQEPTPVDGGDEAAAAMVANPVAPLPTWISDVLDSELWAARSQTRSSRLSRVQLESLFEAFEHHSGVLSFRMVGEITGTLVGRVQMLLAALSHQCNVDGYLILTADPGLGEARLDLALLRTQFGQTGLRGQ